MASNRQLRKREREAVEIPLPGMSNQQIAYCPDTAGFTFGSHLNDTYTKPGVNSRTETILLLGKTTALPVEKPRRSTVENDPDTTYDVGGGAGRPE